MYYEGLYTSLIIERAEIHRARRQVDFNDVMTWSGEDN